jgi:RNA polymerase sigma factor (sigma-70 family)
LLADDIVHTAYEKLKSSKSYAPEKENYGYLSVVCIRLAYREFMAQAIRFERSYFDLDGTNLLDENDIAEELIRTEDANAVLESLKTLREVERIIINQRYYGNFTFAEIAKSNGIKLNTVLSHHRRALSKLRPQLTKIFDYRKEESYE